MRYDDENRGKFVGGGIRVEPEKLTHTKGPWEAGVNCVWGALGEYVAATKTDVTEDEQQANIKLIAAAPEMLEALEKALLLLTEMNSELCRIGKGYNDDAAHPDCTIEIVRTIISKAKGEI